jgi:hypothetical protein
MHDLAVLAVAGYLIATIVWMAVLVAGMLMASRPGTGHPYVIFCALRRLDPPKPVRLAILVPLLGIWWPLTITIAIIAEREAAREHLQGSAG